MPQPIVVPPRQNPWANMLPQMLMQMAFMKFEHNLAMDREDRRIKVSQEEAKRKVAEEKRKEVRKKKEKIETEVRTAAGRMEEAGWTQVEGAPILPEDKYRTRKVRGRMFYKKRPPKPTRPPAKGYTWVLATDYEGREHWKQQRMSEEDQLLRWIKIRNSAPAGSYVRTVYDQAIKKAVTRSGEVIEVSPDGAISIRRGAGAVLAPQTKTAVEKRIINLTDQLQNVSNLGGLFKRDYLTYYGRIKRFTLRELSKANIDIGTGGREFLGGARSFIEQVEQVFHAYRKEITGAQATMREVSMLRNSLLNKKLAPDEFEASLNNYVNKIKRSLRLQKMFLRQGLSGRALGSAIDKRFTLGLDVPDSEVDQRGDELELEYGKQGFTGQALERLVIKQLQNEGYL